MKEKIVRILSLVLVLSFCMMGCGKDNRASAMKIEAITQEEDTLFSCTYDGVAHEYLLELPEDTQGAPLVLLLHGYGNTAKSFRSSIHFEEKANPLGYAVVYVTGAANPGDAPSAVGWNSGMSADGTPPVQDADDL